MRHLQRVVNLDLIGYFNVSKDWVKFSLGCSAILGFRGSYLHVSNGWTLSHNWRIFYYSWQQFSFSSYHIVMPSQIWDNSVWTIVSKIRYMYNIVGIWTKMIRHFSRKVRFKILTINYNIVGIWTKMIRHFSRKVCFKILTINYGNGERMVRVYYTTTKCIFSDEF